MCFSTVFKKKCERRATFWRIFFFGKRGEASIGVSADIVEHPFPYHILLSAILGSWLLFSPHFFGVTGIAASNLYISGALIITFAVIALSEVARMVRVLNIFGGLWIAGSAWVLGDLSQLAQMHSTILGLMLAVLSLPRGKVREHFGSLDSWSRWRLRAWS